MWLKAFSIILFLLTFSSINCFNQQTKNNLIQATVNDAKSPWSVQASTIGKDSELGFIYAVDENSLMSMSLLGDYIIYKSLDAGENWKKFSVLPDYGIYSLSFFNSAEGISTAYKSDPRADSSLRTLTVLRTEDGGLNWKPVYEVSLETTLNLQTDKDKTAVILGQKCILDCLPDKAGHFTNLLLISQDKGENWTDMSETLNKYLNNSAKPSNELLNSVIISGDKGIIGVSNKNNFYKTTDFGKSWKEITNISYDVPPMIIASKFGELPDNKLWATGSSRSVEGQMALLSVSENRNSWNTYFLNDYYFFDVDFLSATEVIAIAYKYPPQTNNKGQKPLGSVLSSDDGGKTWSVVYEMPDSGEINLNSIIKLSNQKLIINGSKTNLIMSKQPAADQS